MRHLARPPAVDVPTHPEHMLNGLRLILNQERVDVGPVHWVIRTSDRGDAFNVRGKRGKWTVDTAVAANADLEVIGSRRSLAEYLTTTPRMRSASYPGIELKGSDAEISRFLKAIAVFPQLAQAPGQS